MLATVFSLLILWGRLLSGDANAWEFSWDYAFFGDFMQTNGTECLVMPRFNVFQFWN